MDASVFTYGKKLITTQKFDQNGKRLPITFVGVESTKGFKPGDIVKIAGKSKGKGFAGGVKRWGFSGGPKTHGQSDRQRAPGSIGQTTTPGRVFKGKHMAGRMGGDRVTIAGLTVMAVLEKEQQLWIKGLIPGAIDGRIEVKKWSETKKFVPILGENAKAEIVPNEDEIKEQLAKQKAIEEEQIEAKTEGDKNA